MKIKYFSMIIMLIIGLLSTAMANNIMESLIDNNRLGKALEKDAVEAAIVDGNVINTLIANIERFPAEDFSGITGPEDLVYGEPYKVALANKDLLTALQEGKKLSGTVLALPYVWEVPVLLKDNPEKAFCTFIVAFHNNAWRVVEIGGFLAKDEIVFAASKRKQLEVLKKNAVTNGTSCVHIRFSPVKIDYLYVESNNQEIFLPLNHRRNIGKNTDTPGKEKLKQNLKEVKTEIEKRWKELYGEQGKDGGK